MKIKALFLDRDGTLVEDNGYVHRVEDFKLRNGVIDGLKLALNKGFKLFVVSNQGGVSLNKFSIKDMEFFNEKLKLVLFKKGIKIEDIKCCIHHPRAANKKMRVCDCRKPSPKMILDLSRKYNVELKKSYMIGDSDVDIETGKNAGCKTLLVKEDNFYKTILKL